MLCSQSSCGCYCHKAMTRAAVERLVAIGLAAVEADLCDAVNDDPVERTAETVAALVRARGDLRDSIDTHLNAR